MVSRTKAWEMSYQSSLRCFYYKFPGETGLLSNLPATGMIPGSQFLTQASRSRQAKVVCCKKHLTLHNSWGVEKNRTVAESGKVKLVKCSMKPFLLQRTVGERR